MLKKPQIENLGTLKTRFFGTAKHNRISFRLLPEQLTLEIQQQSVLIKEQSSQRFLINY